MGSMARQLKRQRSRASSRLGRSRFAEVDARDIRANPAFAGVGPFEAVYSPEEWIRLNAAAVDGGEKWIGLNEAAVDGGEEGLPEALAHAMAQLDSMVKETFGFHIERADARVARVETILAAGGGDAARTFEILLDWANRRLVELDLPVEISEENLAWAGREPLCP